MRTRRHRLDGILDPRAAGERGSALLIALVMISVVALLATAVLSYTGTSITATDAVRGDRNALYAADSAVDTAIQRIKTAPVPDGLGYENGDDCDLDVPVQGDQPAVHVECVGATEATDVGSGDGGNTSNQPKFAIQTLGRRSNQAGPPNRDVNNFADLLAFWSNGSAAEPGLLFSPSFSNAAGVAKLKGGVFSNSTVVADTGTLLTDPDTTFTTRQGCTVSRGGAILVEGSGTNPNCVNLNHYPGPGGYGDDADVTRNDPKFTSRADLQGIPTNRPALPACSGNLMTFEPGWYDDATALSNLMRTCKGTDGLGADFWFRPGLYYFDFRDTTTPTCNDGGGGQVHEWCVGDQKGNPRIVGGTPMGWDPDPAEVEATFTPTTATSTNFSNAADGAEIDGDDATANPLESGSNAPHQATDDDGGEFTNEARAYAISGGTIGDSNSARFQSTSGNRSADLELEDYPSIPSNATPTDVRVRVRHRESSTSGIGTLRMDVRNGSSTLCSQNLSPSSASNPAIITWTLPASCLNTAAKVNAASIRFSVGASGSSSRTFWLDGIELDVEYGSGGSRQIVVSGFDATVPSDATNISATLTVDHDASGGTGPQVVLSPGGATCTKDASGNGEVELDVSSCLNTPAKFANLAATYSATMSAGTSISVDGMRLDVSYQAITRPTFPGACDPDEPGVQFVFAGDSRVRFVDGTVNLCAGPPPGSPGQPGYSAQHIAVYGNRPLPALTPSGPAGTVPAGVANAQHATIMAEQPINQSATLAWEVPWLQSGSSPTLGLAVAGLNASGYPSLPANTRIARVEMRAQYNTHPDFWGTIFGTAPTLSARVVPPGGATNHASCHRSGMQSNSGQALEDWGEPKQEMWDVTNCFRVNQSQSSSAVDLDKLRDFRVDVQGQASCGFFAFGSCDLAVDVDGIELELTLEPVDANQPAALPAQGCVTAKPNYGRGNNGGDDRSCAVLRWGSSDGWASGTTDLFNQIFGNDPNAPATMVSISGTVYTPGAAIDVAEYGRYCQQTRKNRFLWWVWEACDGTNANAFSGVNYPVVDRGIIARTVRIRGLKVDPEYTDYVVGCGRDDCGNTTVPNPKLVTLEAQIANEAGTGETRVTAAVCFGPVTTGPPGPTDVEIPERPGSYCTGEGTGAPVVASWRDERAHT